MQFWLKFSFSIVEPISIFAPRFENSLCPSCSSQVGREGRDDKKPIKSFSIVLSTCKLELLLIGMPVHSLYKKHSHDHI